MKGFMQEWESLGNIPINNDGKITQDFLHFPIGTDVSEIWHYLEDKYDITLGDILC